MVFSMLGRKPWRLSCRHTLSQVRASRGRNAPTVNYVVMAGKRDRIHPTYIHIANGRHGTTIRPFLVPRTRPNGRVVWGPVR